MCPDGATIARCRRQRIKDAPSCGQRIYGSLKVVLTLRVASAHKYNMPFARTGETACLSCSSSPTGLCAYHASLLVKTNHLNTTRVLFLQ
jgi:hypothetical protein